MDLERPINVYSIELKYRIGSDKNKCFDKRQHVRQLIAAHNYTHALQREPALNCWSWWCSYRLWLISRLCSTLHNTALNYYMELITWRHSLVPAGRSMSRSNIGMRSSDTLAHHCSRPIYRSGRFYNPPRCPRNSLSCDHNR